jgi:hypothetical protein
MNIKLWAAPRPPDTVARVLPLVTAPLRVSMMPRHLIPQELLLWGAKTHWGVIHEVVLDRLTRLKLYISPGSDVDQPEILHGIGAEHLVQSVHGVHNGSVGLRRNRDIVYGMKRSPTWPEDHVISFDIDGPGGERIDEVSVSVSDGLALAFKVSCLLGFLKRKPC